MDVRFREMPDKWKDVWCRKSVGYVARGDLSIEDLLSLDGFSPGFGYISPENWFEYVRDICQKLGLTRDDEILEVGCGTGAFMHALLPSPKKIIGVDYSACQIKVAKAFKSKNMTFLELDANEIHILDRKFDMVFVNSLIQYFSSIEYTNEFIGKTVDILKNGGRGCLLDINDIEKRDDFIRSRYDEYGGKEKYLKRYEGLEHAFYSKDQIFETFDCLGVRSVRIEDQFIRNCRTNEFRFNVFFEK